MKIKNGFVSNSSSSSFIVAFDIKPDIDCDLKYMLFGEYPDGEVNCFKNPDYYPEYECECNEKWTGDEISVIVMKELKHQKPLTREEAIKIIRSGGFSGCPEYTLYHGDVFVEEDDSEDKKKHKAKARKDHYEKQDKKRNKAAENFYDNFISGLPKNTILFTFEYSDNDGAMFSAMEHGNLFRRFKHIRIDNH